MGEGVNLLNLYIKNMKLTLETSDLKYETEAETIDATLAKLNLSWEQIKAKGVVTVSNGEKSYSHIFYLKQLKRIFANKTTRLLWAKRLDLLLKAGKRDNFIK